MQAYDLELLEQAELARTRAHAPYSKFKVGATLVAEDGTRFDGCNVENRSLGLTICAERVAVGSAVTHGKTRFRSLAIVSDSSEPVVPCGACRQVLAEFNPHLRIISSNLKGRTMEFDLATLFPLPHQGILA